MLPLSGLKTIDVEGVARPFPDPCPKRTKCPLLASCRQPNRRCGRGGAGARTAAESDDAQSRQYVRPGALCYRSRFGHALQCGVACGARCWGSALLLRIGLEGADGVGSIVVARLHATCRQPNRRCGRGGAGARTAAESDDAQSRQYVRPGDLCYRSRFGMRCSAGSRVVRCARRWIGLEGPSARMALGRWSRVGCTRLAGNQIGDAGVEALARALPPSLTTLKLHSTCSPGLFAIALGLGMRCSAGRM